MRNWPEAFVVIFLISACAANSDKNGSNTLRKGSLVGTNIISQKLLSGVQKIPVPNFVASNASHKSTHNQPKSSTGSTIEKTIPKARTLVGNNIISQTILSGAQKLQVPKRFATKPVDQVEPLSDDFNNSKKQDLIETPEGKELPSYSPWNYPKCPLIFRVKPVHFKC